MVGDNCDAVLSAVVSTLSAGPVGLDSDVLNVTSMLSASESAAIRLLVWASCVCWGITCLTASWL